MTLLSCAGPRRPVAELCTSRWQLTNQCGSLVEADPGGSDRTKASAPRPACGNGDGGRSHPGSGATDHHGIYVEHSGSAPTVPPGWHLDRARGRAGHPDLTWAVRSGDWMMVAMNADGSRPVNMQVNAAATLPALPWIATGLLIGGIIS